MNVFRLAVMSLAVSLSASALADLASITEMFPDLKPVVEYDAVNWNGSAIPNSGSANTGPQVGGSKVLDPSRWSGFGVTSEADFGAPVHVSDDGRSYMSFKTYGHMYSESSALMTRNVFNASVGYTLVGYYRFTENFRTFQDAGIGTSFKGNENSLIDVGWNGSGRKSVTRMTGPGGAMRTDDISGILPEDGWFQIVKTFDVATGTVCFYINGKCELSTTLALDVSAGVDFNEYVRLGDIGIFESGGFVEHHQLKGLDYGYFAVYNRVLSADEVRDSYVYIVGVPEPATMSLLALGGLAVLRRRSR